MPKKRRLTDLFVVGRELTIDDGDGEPITVYLRKLNPVDHDNALRRANAARSRVMSLRSDTDSDEYQSLAMLVNGYTPDDLVEYLVEDLKQSRNPVISARVADEEQWSKDNYLQGLLDDWNDNLQQKLDVDPGDPEADRVRAEIDKYETQVAEELQAEVDDFEAAIGERPVEELRDKVLDKIFDIRASIAWLTEFRKCEVWLSVRDTDRKTRYFTSRDEIDELEAQVFQEISNGYLALSVDPNEGKDSAATPPSSPSSEPPESPAMDDSSGPKDAAA